MLVPGNGGFFYRREADIGTLQGVTARRTPFLGNLTACSGLIPSATAA